MHLFLQLVLITYVNSTVSLIIPHICKKKYVVSKAIKREVVTET